MDVSQGLVFDFPTVTATEGNVKILVPKLETLAKKELEYARSKAPVFYNPAMEFNRDLAISAIQIYQRMVKRDIDACEPLAGCGVRGIRIAMEVDGIGKVIINDISPEAAKLAEYNVKMNKLGEKVTVANEDANLLLSQYAMPRRRFDYIDIDPFGSPVLYLDSALRALRNGALLALTATDLAPLCGVHPKACLRKYGGKPLRTEYCHELATRLVIGCLATVAAKHDIAVNPLLSYRRYNHVRTYVRVSYSAKEADRSIEKMGYVLHCFSCFHREEQMGTAASLRQNCPECGSKLQAAGPLWLGPLWDVEFCVRIRDEIGKRKLKSRFMIGQMMSLIIGEAKAPMTYYVVDKVCDKFNFPIPPLSRVMEELRKLEFQAVATHFSSKAFRTDASSAVVKETIGKLARISSAQSQETFLGRLSM